MSYIYVGTKQSDLDARDSFFTHSIVYYGEQRSNSSVYSQKFRNDNKYEKPFTDFVIREMKSQISADPQCRFVFYANKLAWHILQFAKELKPFIASLNSLELLNAVDNKMFFRAWRHTKTGLNPYRVMTKQEIKYLSPDASYVIQKSISAGGEGTYLWNRVSRDWVFPQLSPSQLYLVSDFMDGLSISCTIICCSERTIVFPPNVQKVLISQDTSYRFLFEGSDFVEGSKLPQVIRAEVRKQALAIGRELSSMGYRGICGIDFMWHAGMLLAMEVNPRFLGSSFLIDAALMDNHLPSLAYFHTLSFSSTTIADKVVHKIENIKIPYYSRVVTNGGEGTEARIKAVLDTEDEKIAVFMDGFRLDALSMSGPDAYLFRIRGTTS